VERDSRRYVVSWGATLTATVSVRGTIGRITGTLDGIRLTGWPGHKCRGPTNDMSPRITFHSCGNSSRRNYGGTCRIASASLDRASPVTQRHRAKLVEDEHPSCRPGREWRKRTGVPMKTRPRVPPSAKIGLSTTRSPVANDTSITRFAFSSRSARLRRDRTANALVTPSSARWHGAPYQPAVRPHSERCRVGPSEVSIELRVIPPPAPRRPIALAARDRPSFGAQPPPRPDHPRAAQTSPRSRPRTTSRITPSIPSTTGRAAAM